MFENVEDIAQYVQGRVEWNSSRLGFKHNRRLLKQLRGVGAKPKSRQQAVEGKRVRFYSVTEEEWSRLEGKEMEVEKQEKEKKKCFICLPVSGSPVMKEDMDMSAIFDFVQGGNLKTCSNCNVYYNREALAEGKRLNAFAKEYFQNGEMYWGNIVIECLV